MNFLLHTCDFIIHTCLSLRVAKDKNELVILLGNIGSVLLDEEIRDEQIRDFIYQKIISKEQLSEKVEECDLLARPSNYNCLDFVESRYNYTRQFSPPFLANFTFRPLKEDDELFSAVLLIEQCNHENKRKIPEDAPIGFIPLSWMEQITKEDATFDRHFYELCTLVKLRDALRSGDIWVEDSRRYTDIKNYLFDDAHWEANKEKYYAQLNLPQDPRGFLDDLEKSFLELSTQVDERFPQNPWAEIVDGNLRVKRVEAAEKKDEVENIRNLIVSALPRVKLPDLLIEVDHRRLRRKYEV